MSPIGYSGPELRDRRLSMARVASGTTGVIRRNAVAVGTVVAAAALVASTAEAVADRTLGIAAFSVSRNGLVVHQLVVAVISGFAIGGVTHVAVSDLHGGQAGVGRAFAAGARLAWPLAGLNIVYNLGVGLASLLLVVPGVMLALRWFVAAPARAVEDITVNDAFARSKELTAGQYWPLLGLLVGYIAFAAAVSFLVGVAAEVLGAEAANVATDAAGAALIDVVGFSGAAVCYAELRRIGDGDAPGQLASVFA